MKKRTLAVVLIILLISVSACGPSEGDLAATDDAIRSRAEEVEATETMMVQLTSDQFAAVQSSTEAASTALAEREAERTATAEYFAAYHETRVYNTLAAQTEEAAQMYTIIQELYDEGIIYSTSGSFQQLPNYEYSFAQMYWIRGYTLPNTYIRDFVLLVDVSWESGSRTAEWRNSGCGVAFRGDEDLSEYYAYMLTLDGNMTFYQRVTQRVTLFKEWYGTIDTMAGSSTFIIVAVGTTYRVYTEDLELIDLRYGEAFREGYIGYIISSGTNADFGTRCTFNDVELWRFDD